MSKLRFKYLFKDHFSWQDSEFIRKVRSHPLVNLNKLTTKKLTRVEQEFWFENDYAKNDDYKIWLVYDESRGCAIGYIQFWVDSLIHKRCRFDYTISPEFSYAKYDNRIIKWCINNAIKFEVDMNKLFCYVFPENGTRIELLDKNGFKIDGLLRKHIYKDSEFRNIYLISYLLS